MMVIGAVTVLPSAEVTESMSVVVCAGDTMVLPFGVTEPTPLIETVVAPMIVQLSVVSSPGLMLSGLASKRTIYELPVTSGAVPTVAVVMTVTLPDGPTAVKVSVVVVVGETMVEPVAATLPTPLSMERCSRLAQPKSARIAVRS